MHMPPLHVSDSEDGIHGILCHRSVAPMDTFGSQCCHEGIDERLCVGIGGNGFCNFLQLLDDNVNDQQYFV